MRSNITLEPTALIGKHFAKMKSKMLTNESCGSAWRSAAPTRRRVGKRAVAHWHDAFDRVREASLCARA